ncbi:MAG: hypothetical protein J6B77_01820 [Clostridia bacterium]|nr:hypothetical protein [Clostridia bacterium]
MKRIVCGILVLLVLLLAFTDAALFTVSYLDHDCSGACCVTCFFLLISDRISKVAFCLLLLYSSFLFVKRQDAVLHLSEVTPIVPDTPVCLKVKLSD